MREGQIVEKFKAKDGREIIIRLPKKSDDKPVWKYYNKVIKETEFLARREAFVFSDKDKWWNRKKITDIKKKKLIQLFAEHSGEIVGSCLVERNWAQVSEHTGLYGISVLRNYWGVGLGNRMTRHAFSIAKEIGIKMIELDVYSGNKTALNMYRKLGFRKVGVLPKWIKHRTKTRDKIIMYKVLK